MHRLNQMVQYRRMYEVVQDNSVALVARVRNGFCVCKKLE